MVWVLLLSMLAAANIDAQSTSTLKFAPKTGFNFADFSVGQPGVDASLSKLGWNLGIDATYGRRFLTGAGLHFYRLGAAIKMKDEDFTDAVISSQLKLPVGVGLQVLKIDYFRVLVKGDFVFNYTFRVVEGSPRQVVSDYQKVTLGSRLGIGIELGRFSIDFNYEKSLSNPTADSRYAQNQLVSVLLGLRI